MKNQYCGYKIYLNQMVRACVRNGNMKKHEIHKGDEPGTTFVIRMKSGSKFPYQKKIKYIIARCYSTKNHYIIFNVKYFPP